MLVLITIDRNIEMNPIDDMMIDVTDVVLPIVTDTHFLHLR